MHNLKNQAGAYLGNLGEAISRANGFIAAVALGWAVLPFVAQTAFFHPSNAIKVQFKLQGLHPPHAFTSQQLTVGFIEALVAVCVLLLVQMCLTVLFYRKAQMQGIAAATPALWPLAALAGVFGNAAWFFGTGAFDGAGCAIGLSSAVLTVVAEVICNKLGREFVLGPSAQTPLLFGPAYAQPQQGPVSFYIPE